MAVMSVSARRSSPRVICESSRSASIKPSICLPCETMRSIIMRASGEASTSVSFSISA
jgi:hypothetical protein